jgi:hypothetical protein
MSFFNYLVLQTVSQHRVSEIPSFILFFKYQAHYQFIAAYPRVGCLLLRLPRKILMRPCQSQMIKRSCSVTLIVTSYQRVMKSNGVHWDSRQGRTSRGTASDYIGGSLMPSYCSSLLDYCYYSGANRKNLLQAHGK